MKAGVLTVTEDSKRFQLLPLGPNILGTAFLPKLFPPFIVTLGTPATTLGSLINSLSSLAGILQITLLYSPLKLPLGLGTAALLHK